MPGRGRASKHVVDQVHNGPLSLPAPSLFSFGPATEILMTSLRACSWPGSPLREIRAYLSQETHVYMSAQPVAVIPRKPALGGSLRNTEHSY